MVLRSSAGAEYNHDQSGDGGGGAALISTAIGELMEDEAADAVRMRKGEWKVMVVRADRLKAVGADVTTLAQALEVLARRAEP